MTEKRFTYLNTTGWNKDGFLNTMNGLNEKNKKLQKENEQLKQVNEMLQMDLAMTERNLIEENERLKKELFETRKDYILETYADNPVRRDEKLKALEKELEE